MLATLEIQLIVSPPLYWSLYSLKVDSGQWLQKAHSHFPKALSWVLNFGCGIDNYHFGTSVEIEEEESHFKTLLQDKAIPIAMKDIYDPGFCHS